MHAGWADYLGCYADNATTARLPVYTNADVMNRFRWSGGLGGGNESLDSCFAAALAGNFSLFGMKEGGECFLGSNMTLATALGPSTSCWYLCPGNASQICGGAAALSLYAVRGTWLDKCRRCHAPQPRLQLPAHGPGMLHYGNGQQ